MGNVKIRKIGTFYNVFDDDCYILYFFFNYNIKNNKVGFPKSALNKVINKLEEFKINYEVIGDCSNNFKNLNKYSKYLKLGFEKYNKDIKYTNIMEKLGKVNDLKLERILMNIEEILDE